MRLIYLLVVCVFGLLTISSASVDNEGLTDEHYRAAREYGFRNKFKLKNEYAKAVDETPTQDILEFLNHSYEKDDWELTLREHTDNTIQIILKQADAVLRKKGHDKIADKIAAKLPFYENYLVDVYFGEKELGDHAPLSEWLDEVHDDIETAIGDEWCKFWHFHDLEIINHSIPVVLKPDLYDLNEYKDHFAGHHLIRFQWEHHGLAGVITYWLVNVACIYGTSGIGVISFACSAVAAGAEHVMDKNIAPPVAERIWFRYNT